MTSAVVDNGSNELMNGCESGSLSLGMTKKSTDMRELGLSTSWSTITLIVGLSYSATGTHQLGRSARYHADQTNGFGLGIGHADQTLPSGSGCIYQR